MVLPLFFLTKLSNSVHSEKIAGYKYDKYGNLRNWWTNSAFEMFRTKSKCIIDQYNNYSIPGIDQKVHHDCNLYKI